MKTVGPPPAKFKIDPYYTKFTWAREFTVVGLVPADRARLHAALDARFEQMMAAGLLQEVRRLQKEPRSFATLAQSRSHAPEASQGGLMGRFAQGQLPPELDEAAFGLPVGTTSGIVATPLGYHVLRVDERQPSRQRRLEECRDEIRTRLGREKSELATRQFVRGLLARAKVNHEALEDPRS